MIVVTGRVECDAADTAEFETAARDVVTGTTGSTGCLEYSCSRDLTDPGAFVFVERWADQDALRAHMATDHYRIFRTAAAPLMRSAVVNIHTVEKTQTV